MRSRSWLVCLTLAFTPGIAAQQVSGGVYESSLCSPLGNVTLRFTPPKESGRATVVTNTDNEGAFVVKLPKGDYYISILFGAQQLYGKVISVDPAKPLNIVLQSADGKAPIPECFLVIVRATERWTETPVKVQQGETISFSAKGQIQWGNGSDARVGPGGSTRKLKPRVGSYPVRTMGAGGLIGKIGTKGVPFAVGEKVTITAPTSGMVYLGINDNVFTDNSETFQVTITKQ